MTVQDKPGKGRLIPVDICPAAIVTECGGVFIRHEVETIGGDD
jgi:hypothetical protein